MQQRPGMVTDITPGQKMVALASRNELIKRHGYHNVPARLARVA